MAGLKPYYFMPITKKLAKVYNQASREVLAFARFKAGDAKLDNLSKYPALEKLCDALFLVNCGAIECDLTDCLPDGLGDEGIVLKLNVE